MEDVKSALSSKTVWGGILAVVGAIGGMFGYALSAEDAATLSDLLPAIVSGVGGVVAIVGRIMATKAIK